MQRRQLLKSTAAFSAATVLAAPAIAQAPKKITFLTWNLVHLEAPDQGLDRGLHDDAARRRGRMGRQEGPRAAGLLPDPARRRHAARRHRHPGRARPRIRRPGRAARPHAAARRGGRGQGPLRARTTSRTGCSRARTTWCPTTSPRRCCSGTRRASRRRASTSRRRASTRSSPPPTRSRAASKTGLLTLNFDWLYWPLMQMNGVDLLSPDLKTATFNTAKAAEVHRPGSPRRPRAAPSTRSRGPAAGSSPTSAFADRQCRHAARPRAGLLLDQGQGAVDQRRHAGRGADAGQLGDAQQPRPRHLQGLARSPSSPGTS